MRVFLPFSLFFFSAISLLAQPGFVLVAPPTTVQAGSTATATIGIFPGGGFASPVTFTATGWPQGVSGTFNLNPTTQVSTTLTITAAANSNAYLVPVTITGTSGSTTASATLTLTVKPPSAPPALFSISATPITVSPGSVGTTTVTINRNAGFNEGVYVGQFPGREKIRLVNPNPVAGTSASVSLSIPGGLATGTYQVPIYGSAVGSTHASTTVTVNVVQGSTTPGYTISTLAPPGPVPAGTTAFVRVAVSPQGGFTPRAWEPVFEPGPGFGASGTVRTGVETSFSLVAVSINSTVAPGIHNVTLNLNGSGNGGPTSVVVPLNVGLPLTNASTSAFQEVNTWAARGFTSQTKPFQVGDPGMTLSTPGWPEGISATFGSTGSSRTATISIDPRFNPTEYPPYFNGYFLPVIATSQAGTSSGTIHLRITDFVLTVANPGLISLNTPQTLGFHITSPVGTQFAFANIRMSANDGGCALVIEENGGVALNQFVPPYVFKAVGTPQSENQTAPDCKLFGPASSTVISSDKTSMSANLSLEFLANWGGSSPGEYDVTIFAPDSWGLPSTRQIDRSFYTFAPQGFYTANATAAFTGSYSAQANLSFARTGGFAGMLNVTPVNWPVGVTATFSGLPTNGNSAVATITIAPNARIGNTLAIRTTSGALTTADSEIVLVGIGPFGTISPSAGSAAPGVAQNFQLNWPSHGTTMQKGTVQFVDPANPANNCTVSLLRGGAANLGPSNLNNWLGYSWSLIQANSFCELNGPASSFPVTGYDSFQVTLNLKFLPVWAGKTLQVFMWNDNNLPIQAGMLTVTGGAPNFTLSAGAATGQVGGTASSAITVNPVNGFSSAVTLSTSNWPAGITGTFSPNPATGAATATINIGSSVAAGSYSLTVNGVSGALTSSTTLPLTVSPSGGGGGTLPYGVSINPASGSALPETPQALTATWASPAGQPALAWGTLLIQDPAAGTSSANGCLVRVYPTGGAGLADNSGAFTFPNVWLGESWTISPSNSKCRLNGPQSGPVTATGGNSNLQARIQLQFNAAWAGKTLNVWMQGTNTSYASGTWQQLSTFTVTGSSPSFTLSAGAASGSPGGTASAAITVISANGFNSAVTLSASNWPSGISGTFSPNPATGTATATITIGSSVAAGSYSLTVNGTSGALNASASIALTVNSGTLPYGVFVNPSASVGAANTPRDLEFAWASPGGQPVLTWGTLLIQESGAGTATANACMIRVYNGGAAGLADNSGAFTMPNVWVGESWTISPSNDRCQLNGPQSSRVTVTGGGSGVQARLNLQFKSIWAGKTLTVWMQGTNTSYQSGSWQQLGTVTVN